MSPDLPKINQALTLLLCKEKANDLFEKSLIN